MPTIAEVRAKYPEYSDLSDKDLADRLHSAFYSDLPVEEFYTKVGLDQAKPGPGTELVRGIKRGWEETKGLVFDVLPALAYAATGSEEDAQKKLSEYKARVEKAAEENPEAVPSLSDIGSFGDFARWTAGAIGELTPSMITALIPGLGGGALATRLAGGAALKTLAEAGGKEAAQALVKRQLAGEAVGVGLGSAALNVPETFATISEETGELRPALALGVGAIKSALDTLAPIQILRRVHGKAADPVLDRLILNSVPVTALVKTGSTMATEGLTEGTQEFLDQVAVKLVDEHKELFSPENFKNILEATARGAIGVAPLGGVAGVVEAKRLRSFKEAEEEQAKKREAEEAAQKAEEQRLLEIEKQQQLRVAEWKKAADEGAVDPGSPPEFMDAGEYNDWIRNNWRHLKDHVAKRSTVGPAMPQELLSELVIPPQVSPINVETQARTIFPERPPEMGPEEYNEFLRLNWDEFGPRLAELEEVPTLPPDLSRKLKQLKTERLAEQARETQIPAELTPTEETVKAAKETITPPTPETVPSRRLMSYLGSLPSGERVLIDRIREATGLTNIQSIEGMLERMVKSGYLRRKGKKGEVPSFIRTRKAPSWGPGTALPYEVEKAPPGGKLPPSPFEGRFDIPQNLPSGVTEQAFIRARDLISEKPSGEKVTAQEVGKLIESKKPADQRFILDQLKDSGLLKKTSRGYFIAHPGTVPTPAFPESPTLEESTALARKIAGPEVRVSHYGFPRGTAGAMHGPRSMAIRPNLPRDIHDFVVVHEATHAIDFMEKLTPAERLVLESEQGKKELERLIRMASDRVPYIIHPSHIEYALGSSHERLAFGVESIMILDKAGVRPRGFVADILRKLSNFVKQLLGGTPDTEAILRKILSGEIGKRSPVMVPVHDWPIYDERGNPNPKAFQNFTWEMHQWRSSQIQSVIDTVAHPSPTPGKASELQLAQRDLDDLKRAKNDPIQIMSATERVLMTPHFLAIKYPALRPYVRALESLRQWRSGISHELSDAFYTMLDLRKEPLRNLTKVLEIENASETLATKNPDGSISITVPEELKLPLVHNKPGDAVTLTGPEVEAYTKLRKALDDTYDHIIASTKSRYGFSPTTTPDQIRNAASQESGVRRERLETLAELIDSLEKDYRRRGYIPHIRQGNVGIVVDVPLEGMAEPRRHFYVVDGRPMTFGKVRIADGLKEGKKLAARLKEKFPNAKVSEPFVLTKENRIAGAMSNEQAVNMVERLFQAVLHPEDLGGVQMKAGELTDTMDKFLDLIRLEVQKRGAKAHLRQRKWVPGFIHEGNYDTYLKDTIGMYFNRQGEFLAQAYTAKERQDSLRGLLKNDPSLYNYAADLEEYIHSPETTVSQLKALAFMYGLGYNMSSAVVNLTQTLHTTLPFLSHIGGLPRAVTQLSKAMKDAFLVESRGILSFNEDRLIDINKPKPAGVNEAEWELIKTAVKAGEIEPLLTRDQAYNVAERRKVFSGVVGDKVNRALTAASFSFSAMEQANRLTSLLATYRILKKSPAALQKAIRWKNNATIYSGMEGTDTPEFLARLAVKETQFVVTKENRPVFSRGARGVFFQFTQFPVNMVELMIKAGSYYNGKGFWKSPEGKKFLGLMLTGVFLTAGMWGMPFARPMKDLAAGMMKALAPVFGFVPLDLDKLAQEFAVDIAKEFEGVFGATDPQEIADYILHGPLRAIGIDISRRTSLDILPLDLLTGNKMDAFGPFGGLIFGGVQDAVGYMRQDKPYLAMASLLPLAFRNMIRAVDAHMTGGLWSPTTGRSRIPAGTMTRPEVVASFWGFTPTRIARESERAERLKEDPAKELREFYADSLAHSLLESIVASRRGDEAGAQASRKKFQETVRELVRRNAEIKDPEERIIRTDFKRFMRTVRDRVMKDLTGPAGILALKRVPESVRGAKLRALEEYYPRRPS